MVSVCVHCISWCINVQHYKYLSIITIYRFYMYFKLQNGMHAPNKVQRIDILNNSYYVVVVSFFFYLYSPVQLLSAHLYLFGSIDSGIQLKINHVPRTQSTVHRMKMHMFEILFWGCLVLANVEYVYINIVLYDWKNWTFIVACTEIYTKQYLSWTRIRKLVVVSKIQLSSGSQCWLVVSHWIDMVRIRSTKYKVCP